jgi:hypothetical protein
MAFLTREQILNMKDLSEEIVEVRSWGGEVIVRGASAFDREAYEQAVYITTEVDGKTKVVFNNSITAKIKLVVKCVFDGEGKRLFQDTDEEALGGKLSGPINKIFKLIQTLSAMGDEEETKTAKNSGAGGKTEGTTPPSNTTLPAT